MIYSPAVRIMCDSGGPLAEDAQVDVSVVSVAAQDLRPGRHYSKPFDPDLLREKVRAMLSVCEQHGHDAVVLGAFGCGAFQHDPKNVAKVFQELLTQEFRVFRVAIFAILCSKTLLDEFEKIFPALPNQDPTFVREVGEDLRVQGR